MQHKRGRHYAAETWEKIAADIKAMPQEYRLTALKLLEQGCAKRAKELEANRQTK